MRSSPLSFKSRRVADRGRRSSALILVLFFVVLLSVLLIGFLASMRVERSSAESHLSGVVADIYADAGTRVALGQLYTATANPFGYFLSQPGAISYVTNSVTGYMTNVSLSPGTNGITSAAPSADAAVDLNSISSVTGAPIITGANNPTLPTTTMYVQWIYQYRDGSFSTNLPSTSAAPSNPVVGRFAYWVDDESSKINLNTALDRTSSNATNLSTPSRVSLDVFSAADAAAVKTYTSANNFNSVQEITRASGVTSALTNQLFAATAYSHSPAMSMIGQPRILLTTQKWLADANGTTNFLDILKTESTAPNGVAGHVDPGNLFTPGSAAPAYSFNIDPTKACNVLTRIAAELGTNNWPFAPGKSLNTKYPSGGGSPDVYQIAMNIVDYVRSVESTNVVIEPFRLSIAGTAFTPWTDDEPIAAHFSYGRRLYITEAGVWFTNNAPKNFKVPPPARITPLQPGSTTAYVLEGNWYYKMYLPYFPGSSSVNLSSYRADISVMNIISPPTSTNRLSTFTAATQLYPTQIVYPIPPPTVLKPGHSVTIKGGTCDFWNTNGTTFSYPTVMSYQFQIEHANNWPRTRVDLSNDSAAANGAWTATAVGPGGMTTVSVEDWHVNEANADWQPTQAPFSAQGTQGNQLGVDGLSTVIAPTYLLPPSTSITPGQDTDGSGKITTNYMWTPAPAGDPSNPDGIVHSVGELGFVHTGTDANTTGVPWKTIHLQPMNSTDLSKNYIPDWAILDLFAAPVYTNVVTAGSLPYFLPYSTNISASADTNIVSNIGGQINLNAAITGLSTANNSSLAASRLLPTQALFNGAANVTANSSDSTAVNYLSMSAGYLSLANASTVANNIMNFTTVNTGSSYGNHYYTPAQVAEIKGVADAGEASEATIRDITGQASANGSVFSIYTVGQSLKQDVTGAIHVLGERRKQTIVERVVIPPVNGSSAGTPPTVQLQPVATRNMQ